MADAPADSRKKQQSSIMVVDDDVMIRNLLSSTLEMEGYAPIVCADSQAALEMSKQENFSLAFVDINLPGMSGLDLATRLKEDTPMREVVFITGSESLENAVQAIKIGAYDYLKKPFRIEEFNLCLRRFEEKEALREKIRLAEQRHFQLVQNIPLLIYVLNRELQVVFVNRASSSLLGYDPEEAVNTPDWFLTRIHEDSRKKAAKKFKSAFDLGISVSMECRFVHKDGHYIHALLKSMPHTGYGTTMGDEYLEGFVLDISDRVFLEKSLIHREKLKTLGAISAEVAHEIRNPLMSIGGFAKRLKRKYPDLHECEIILNESRRLEKILSRIRNYLEPVEIHPKKCSVGNLVEDCLDLLSPEMEKKQVDFELEMTDDLPHVYADPEVLTQIFINLVRNAVSATNEQGKLMIRGYAGDPGLCIEFSNQASGATITHPETLFLPFADGGQSFGLPLCYRLVKDMGGLLSFSQDSKCITFTLSLPRSDD